MAIPAPVTDQTNDPIVRMRLALLPRFAAAIMVFDDEESARSLYDVCDVEGCLRVRRLRGLCMTHRDPWRRKGRPDLEQFRADPGPPTRPERIRLDGLPSPARVELGLALQLAASRPRQRSQIAPGDVQRLVQGLQSHGVASILVDVDVDAWSKDLPKPVRRVLAVLRHVLEDFVAPPNPTTEFDRDVWRLGVMGHSGRAGANGRLRFDGIPQPWLRHLIKRFMRWRIAIGRSYHSPTATSQPCSGWPTPSPTTPDPRPRCATSRARPSRSIWRCWSDSA